MRQHWPTSTAMALVLVLLSACVAPAVAAECAASWYGGGERLARLTANGEVFDPGGMTVAHRTLPFGTLLRVWHDERTVLVRVNDRGPAKWTGRCLDLSRAAAVRLGLLRKGVGWVRFYVARTAP